MRWEYKTEVRDYSELQTEKKRLDYLNKQGAEGWEFINMNVEEGVKVTFWFKRMVDNRRDDLQK